MKKTTAKTKSSKATLGSAIWFKSANARPKFISATLVRTSKGYRVVSATAQHVVNQFRSTSVIVDAAALTQDIQSRGFIG